MRVLLIQGRGHSDARRTMARLDEIHAATPLDYLGYTGEGGDGWSPLVWSWSRHVDMAASFSWNVLFDRDAPSFASRALDEIRPDLVLVALGGAKREPRERRLAREALLAEAEKRGVKIETIR